MKRKTRIGRALRAFCDLIEEGASPRMAFLYASHKAKLSDKQTATLYNVCSFYFSTSSEEVYYE